jgi:hypothetical protein
MADCAVEALEKVKLQRCGRSEACVFVERIEWQSAAGSSINDSCSSINDSKLITKYDIVISESFLGSYQYRSARA